MILIKEEDVGRNCNLNYKIVMAYILSATYVA